MQIRVYTIADYSACLAIFQGNVPDYFSPEELADFGDFLRQPDCPYFVVEEAGELVGCGGYVIFQHQRIAGLVYGMVRRDWHKAGVGKFLLLARLREICHHHPQMQVVLDTSQHTSGFFAKFGFQIEKITEDFYGAGLHRYDMALTLTEEYCTQAV
jgi:predicted GNAT family N-acyltransferase